MKRRRATEGQLHVEFAALLASPETSWVAVMARLASWPADQGVARAIEAAEAVAERWPRHARGPGRLTLQQLAAGQVRSHVRLVRALDLRPLWRVPDRPGLLGRMIREGGVRELELLVTRHDRGEELIRLVTRHVVGLRGLAIGGSGVGPDGARALAEAPALAGLRRLALHNNRIDDAGAEALVESPHLGALRYLNLYGNTLGAGAVLRVRGAPRWLQAGLVVHGQRAGE